MGCIQLRLALIVCLVSFTSTWSPAQQPAADVPEVAPPQYMGRTIAQTMHYLGAEWLTRDTREREEACSKLIAALALEPGQMVCDLGCGNGFYTLEMAPLIGPQGVVWAVDIQPEMLTMLGERAEKRGISNIKPVLGTIVDPKLPDGLFDLLLLVDVYHEFSNPEEMLREMRESLKPEGRIALVEYREEDPEVPIKPLHKMSQQQVLKEYEANGFKLVGQFDELPWQHVFFFARDDSPLEAVELKAWQKPGRNDELPNDE
ncbi:MAG: methyltransferase domain-containing protein [Pirellulales bacterium]